MNTLFGRRVSALSERRDRMESELTRWLVGLEPAQRVRAILNFAPVKVFAPHDVIVRQVDFSSELMSLSFYLDRES